MPIVPGRLFPLLAALAWVVACCGWTPTNSGAALSQPRAEILLLQADATYTPQDQLRLPPGTAQLRIDYTGLGAGKPGKLRFQYRLDGVDHDWQNADTRRSAYDTNLGPGDYRFLLRAVNEDGVGMPADVAAAQSKPGHWGLEGLQERARRLQAGLELETGAGGRVWRISVLATLAYRRRASEAEA